MLSSSSRPPSARLSAPSGLLRVLIHVTLQTGVSPLQESELSELKETIEILKTKNTEAQEIIQGALSHPDMAPQGMPL